MRQAPDRLTPFVSQTPVIHVAIESTEQTRKTRTTIGCWKDFLTKLV
jgi:hypothetical protein